MPDGLYPWEPSMGPHCTCPRCQTDYHVTEIRLIGRHKETYRCDICSEVLYAINNAADYRFERLRRRGRPTKVQQAFRDKQRQKTVSGDLGCAPRTQEDGPP